ncbi:MAG: hypothetical protein JWM21_4968 [Acidobacteria bacterium]|nr:hypothetical protein [Acidobacteriota bacterium]
MQYDRRNSQRVEVTLSTTWEGVLERNEATITSLSLNGCFVLSGGRVQPKELLRLEIQLPEGGPVKVWAEVVDQDYEIGFAARFTSPSEDEDQQRLLQFISEALGAI